MLCAVFFVSGASGLVFETLWFHQAGLALGNSVWASSLVLAGFMGGLALGNFVAARYGERFGHPVRAYAVLEAVIAVTGVGLVYLLPRMGPALAALLGPLQDQPGLLNTLRLVTAFALLLVPSSAMGATLPLLTRALAARDACFGRVLGRLYGWNTLGAVAGVAVAEWVLIGALGVRGSALAAGGLNGLAALGAIAVARGTRDPAPSPDWVGLAQGRAWLLAAAVAGFSLLALEVIWFRFLSLFVSAETESFAVMLAVVLAGIALGALAGSLWLRRAPEAHRAAGPVALGAGLLCAGGFGLFRFVIAPFGSELIRDVTSVLALSVPLMLPVSVLSGVLFTLLGAGLRRESGSATETAGALTFANTLGSAIGSLVAGFVLLPLLGMEASLFALAVLYGALGGLLLLRRETPPVWAWSAAVPFALAVAFFPWGSVAERYVPIPLERWRNAAGQLGPPRVESMLEGTSETVMYVERLWMGQHRSHQLFTNGFSMSSTAEHSRRYMKLYVYLPAALHPGLRSALLISYGVGSTAKALTDTRELERIDVVDISREILQASDVVFPDPNEHPLRDPRVHVHVEDGRYFLMTTDQRFDLITSEPPPPTAPGVTNLYSREYFELIRDRLNDGGMATYWLPIHAVSEPAALAILRAFCDAFQDCSLWNGHRQDLMMVGTRDAQGPVDPERFGRQWRDRTLAPELAALGFELPEQLGALFIGDADYLRALTRDVEPVTDDFPKRISAGGNGTLDVYRDWLDVEQSRRRFVESPWVARLWPPSTRAASEPYFAFQRSINEIGYGTRPDPDSPIPEADRILRDSELRYPVLWLLGSRYDIQRIVRAADPELRAHPAVQYHVALGHVAEREYAAAVGPLERAEVLEPLRRDAFRLRVYALCMADRCDEAKRLARDRYRALGDRAVISPYWQWLEQRFGLEVLERRATRATPDRVAGS